MNFSSRKRVMSCLIVGLLTGSSVTAARADQTQPTANPNNMMMGMGPGMMGPGMMGPGMMGPGMMGPGMMGPGMMGPGMMGPGMMGPGMMGPGTMGPGMMGPGMMGMCSGTMGSGMVGRQPTSQQQNEVAQIQADLRKKYFELTTKANDEYTKISALYQSGKADPEALVARQKALNEIQRQMMEASFDAQNKFADVLGK